MQSITIERTVKWFNKTEGRDKICKVMQYGSRLLMWHLKNQGSEEWSNSFKALYTNMSYARKLFRLAKTLNEIQTIIDKIKKGSDDPISNGLQILTRIWFGLYWIFDNLTILSTIKFMAREPKPLQKKAMLFWFLGLVTSLADVIRQYVLNILKIQKLAQNVKNGQNVQQNEALIGTFKANNQALFVNLIKIFGDLMPAGQGSEFIPKLFGYNLNDGQIGVGGLISGALSAYAVY